VERILQNPVASGKRKVIDHVDQQQSC
jgi:hypothetical protein